MSDMGVTVLRLGHRHYRDQRLTTHVALTARALGAEKVILSGEKDEKIIGSVEDIARRWGGDFAMVGTCTSRGGDPDESCRHTITERVAVR